MIVLAHPLLQPGGLPVPPIFIGAVTVAAALLIARLVPTRSLAGPPLIRRDARGIGFWLPRLIGIAILLAAVWEGRTGNTAQLDNLAAALVIGVAWPMLLLASVLFGDVWDRLNPWDTIALVLGAREGNPAATVWPAVPAAAAWCWYLGAYRDALQPRSVGLALGVYTVVTVAACLLVGRVRWLRSGEPFTIVFGWLAGLRRGELVTWVPPNGTLALLGFLAGGLLFGALRYSTLWQRGLVFFGISPISELATTVGLCVAMLLGVLVLHGCARWSRRPGTVAAAALPLVAALGIALGLARDRLFTAAQVVVNRVLDSEGITAAPLGTAGLVVVQVLVLLAGGVAAAAIVRRRGGPSEPALFATGTLVVLGVLAVTAVTPGVGGPVPT